MTTASKRMSEWEQKYFDVTELYSLSDDLLATVETAADPEAQLALIAPLVEAIGEQTDLLTQEYIALCENKKDLKTQSRIETALRKTYGAIAEFTERARDTRNAALAIVKKLKRQLEQVIVNFMEFVTISLDRVMQKHDVEELKQRHAHIALMLHQHQMGQQGA